MMSWEQTTVFLVGGGPSARSFDWDSIRGRGVVVVCNDACLKLPWADVCFTIDDYWLTRRADQLDNFGGEIVAAVHEGFRPPPVRRLKLVRRVDYAAGLSKDPNIVFEGGNSGFGALCYAVAMGSRQINLIGYDLNGPGHWFGEYEWKSRFGLSNYPQWVHGFEYVAPLLQMWKVHVTNLNPNSAIKCFPFATLQSHAKTEQQEPV